MKGRYVVGLDWRCVLTVPKQPSQRFVLMWMPCLQEQDDPSPKRNRDDRASQVDEADRAQPHLSGAASVTSREMDVRKQVRSSESTREALHLNHCDSAASSDCVLVVRWPRFFSQLRQKIYLHHVSSGAENAPSPLRRKAAGSESPKVLADPAEQTPAGEAGFESLLPPHLVGHPQILRPMGSSGSLLGESRWRRRQGISDAASVCIIKGRYPDICQALIERGWYINPDFESAYWDLKWTTKSRDAYALPYQTKSSALFQRNPEDNLRPHQIVNHFAKGSRICTKAGLLHSLRALPWFEPLDIATFFPRCFDLADTGDYAEFLDDFRGIAAETVLARVTDAVLDHVGIEPPPLRCGPESGGGAAEEAKGEEPITGTGSTKIDQDRDKDQRQVAAWWRDLADNKACLRGASRVCVNKAVFRAALQVARNRARPGAVSMAVVDDVDTGSDSQVNPDAWRLLYHCDVFAAGGPSVQRRRGDVTGPTQPSGGLARWEADDAGSEGSSVRSSDRTSPASTGQHSPKATPISAVQSPIRTASQNRKASLRLRGWDDLLEQRGYGASIRYRAAVDPLPGGEEPSPEGDAPNELEPLDAEDWAASVVALADLAEDMSLQPTLSAWRPRNVWVVKPADKSRGRGIRCMDDLKAILRGRAGPSHKDSNFVVQKYIERPLLIHGFKFDIRQWVLVTCWNPLTVWFYERCYLRFCCHPFSLEDLGDTYIHLANNSIQKHADDFSEHAEDIAEGNMWSSHRFEEWLASRDPQGRNVWAEDIQPRLRKAVVYSLQAAQDMMDSRANSFALFGYDFLIDSTLRPWLIEINSSPDMSYSTPVTKELVQRVGDDIIKVVVDHRNAETRAKKSDRVIQRRKEDEARARAREAGAWPVMDIPPMVPTGDWSCIHRAPRKVGNPPAGSMPQDFVCVARVAPMRKALSNDAQIP